MTSRPFLTDITHANQQPRSSKPPSGRTSPAVAQIVVAAAAGMPPVAAAAAAPAPAIAPTVHVDVAALAASVAAAAAEVDDVMPPQYVPEYTDEIFGHMLLRELELLRDGDYLARQQPEITERMRTILVDWLIDVHLKFKLHPESFFLAINITDRFLAAATVPRAQLQLVGITATLIAGKHEEIWPPEVRDCVYISANTYSADEVLAMERAVASALHFRFTQPTAYPLMCRMLDLVMADEVMRHAAFYFLDAAAHEYRLVAALPSRVALAAVLLARLLLVFNSGETVAPHMSADLVAACWCPAAARGSATLEDVVPVADLLLRSTATLCSPASRLQAVRRKYLTQRFGGVSALPLPPVEVFESFLAQE